MVVCIQNERKGREREGHEVSVLEGDLSNGIFYMGRWKSRSIIQKLHLHFYLTILIFSKITFIIVHSVQPIVLSTPQTYVLSTKFPR